MSRVITINVKPEDFDEALVDELSADCGLAPRYRTLAEWARVNADTHIADICEILAKQNDIMDDVNWICR